MGRNPNARRSERGAGRWAAAEVAAAAAVIVVSTDAARSTGFPRPPNSRSAPRSPFRTSSPGPPGRTSPPPRDTLKRVVAAAIQQPSVAPGNLQHVGSGSTGQSGLGGLAPNGISAGAASDGQTTAKGRGFELVVASSDANDDGVGSVVVGPFGSAAERD